MTAFFLLFSKIRGCYLWIKDKYLVIIERIPVAEKVSELYETKPLVRTGPHHLQNIEGRVEFRDVTFTYPSRPGHEVLSKAQ